MRTRATTLVFLFCFLLFGPPLSCAARAADKGVAPQKDIDPEVLRSMAESFAATIAAASEDNAALRREIASLREELALVRGNVSQKGEAGGTQPSAVGNAAMLREMQSTEEVQRIISLLRTMKNAAFMYYLYEIMPIREDSTRVNSAKVDYANFRDKVNHDPLAVRNILGKYLDVPATYDESCHFYVLNDNQWLVGYDLAGEDESTLERLAVMARRPGANLVNLDQSIWNGGLVIWVCIKLL
mgnify:CR=1 FL=1